MLHCEAFTLYLISWSDSLRIPVVNRWCTVWSVLENGKPFCVHLKGFHAGIFDCFCVHNKMSQIKFYDSIRWIRIRRIYEELTAADAWYREESENFYDLPDDVLRRVGVFKAETTGTTSRPKSQRTSYRCSIMSNGPGFLVASMATLEEFESRTTKTACALNRSRTER